jgi:aquaporin Z
VTPFARIQSEYFRDLTIIKMSPLVQKMIAEFIGTFWLVFGGCGSAVLAAKFPSDDAANSLGIGLVGVSFAFGLTVLTMAYAIGHISGCHLNPAVSVGLLMGKRFSASEIGPYIGSQVGGAILGSLVILIINQGLGGGTLAANGFGPNSPGTFPLISCLVAEFVLTFMFLIIILGATDRRAPGGFAGLAIGLALTLIHLIGIPTSNVSVNPARSTGPAIITAIAGGPTWPIAQLWLFWLAPIAGAAVAGLVYNAVFEKPVEREVL